MLDASSIMHGWDNYPKSNSLFKNLWDWIENLIQESQLVISDIALQEVENKYPELAIWLKQNNIDEYKMLPIDLSTTQTVKTKLKLP